MTSEFISNDTEVLCSDLIQRDFGGFNPKFQGITVILSSLDAYNIFLDFLFSTNTSKGDPRASFSELALTSVIDHELRHYHDSLISPYGAAALRLRLSGLVNGSQALNLASEIEGNCIPVPLSRWLNMSPEAKERQICSWNDDVPAAANVRWSPIAIAPKPVAASSAGPVLVRHLSRTEQFAHFLAATSTSYSRLDQLLELDAKPFLPAHVFEVTALTVQIASLYQSQGIASALRFAQFLLHSDLPYTRAWRHFYAISALIDQNNIDESALEIFRIPQSLMRVAVWCLLGNYLIEQQRASPVKRFTRLAEYLISGVSDPMNRGEVASVWDHWDRVTGVLPWRQSMTELLAYGQRGLAQMAEFKAVATGNDEIPRVAERVLRRYVSQQSKIVRALLNDPTQLVDVEHYINSDDPDDFGAPVLRVRLEGFAVEIDAVPRNVSHNVTFEDGGKLYSTGFAIDLSCAAAGAQTSFVDDALDFERFTDWCDVAFGGRYVVPESLAAANEGIHELTGKRVLWIL